MQPTSGVDHVTLYNRRGKVVWRIPRAIPVYLKGKLIIVARNQKVGSSAECHDWRARKLKWSAPLNGTQEARYNFVGQWMGAVEKDGRLYWALNADHSVLKVLRVRDGRLLDKTDHEKRGGPLNGWGNGPPAVDDRAVYWGLGHWLHVLDRDSLRPKWAIFDGGNSYLVRAGSLLISKGWSHTMQAWNVHTRKLAWRIGAPRDVAHALISGKGRKRCLIESSSCIDVSTGKSMARYLIGGVPVYANGSAGSGGSVYLAGVRTYLSPTGGFYCFYAQTGKLRWKYERPDLQGVAVIVSERRIYGLGSDGFLYCFGTK